MAYNPKLTDQARVRHFGSGTVRGIASNKSFYTIVERWDILRLRRTLQRDCSYWEEWTMNYRNRCPNLANMEVQRCVRALRTRLMAEGGGGAAAGGVGAEGRPAD